MKKKKAAQSIKLPIHHAHKIPDDAVFVTVGLDPDKLKPLIEPVVAEGTIALVTGWLDNYYVFVPDKPMSGISEDGVRAQITLSPPTKNGPALPMH